MSNIEIPFTATLTLSPKEMEAIVKEHIMQKYGHECDVEFKCTSYNFGGQANPTLQSVECVVKNGTLKKQLKYPLVVSQ